MQAYERGEQWAVEEAGQLEHVTELKAHIDARYAADRERMRAQVVTAFGETQGELADLFAKVEPKDTGRPGTYWKYPIDATVPLADAEKYARAIEFFVGGPTSIDRNERTGFARLTNNGYYHNIGA
jgi:hypothetical protein